MRRPDLEYQIDNLSEKSELRQSFSVRRGFTFDRIDIFAARLDEECDSRENPLDYDFKLLSSDGTLLYTQKLSESFHINDRDASASYQTIKLPVEYGEGDYAFTIQSVWESAPESWSFFARSCLGQNYNPKGELLIDGAEPVHGASNLVFNVY